jgi:hypothetical protein
LKSGEQAGVHPNAKARQSTIPVPGCGETGSQGGYGQRMAGLRYWIQGFRGLRMGETVCRSAIRANNREKNKKN